MDIVLNLKRKYRVELSFSDFIECYQHEVYQLCFYMIGKREVAEQIAQTAFIEAYRNIRVYNNCAKVQSKLFRITVDLVLESLRETTNQITEIENAESIDAIQREIFMLEASDRLAFVLKHIVGYSVEKISDIMQLPKSNVRKKIHFSLEVLRKQMIDKV